jgi:M6 family metalloprotease-like protein
MRAMKRMGVIQFVILIFVLMPAISHTCPVDPFIFQAHSKDEEIKESAKSLPKKAYYAYYASKEPESIARALPKIKTDGKRAILVLLMEFPDKKHSLNNSEDAIGSRIFSSSNPKSVFNYYKKVSCGKLSFFNPLPEMNPLEWFTVSNSMGFYGSNIENIPDGIREIINAFDNAIDFSRFDMDADGEVDHVLVVHAGVGQETNPWNSDLIWSHRADLREWGKTISIDGVKITGYATVSEFSPIGIIAHELGHELGLPDLYNTQTGTPVVGRWCLMDVGCWNNRGYTPAFLSAWCRVLLGWIEPDVVEVNYPYYKLIAIGDSNRNPSCNMICKIPVKENPSGLEYFLIEYRRLADFDMYLPGQGILIWHIDDGVGDVDKNNVNNNLLHLRVDLEERDGSDTSINGGDYGDTFWNENHYFGPPLSNSYIDGKITNLRVEGFSLTSYQAMSMHIWVEKKEAIRKRLFSKASVFPNPIKSDQKATFKISFGKLYPNVEIYREDISLSIFNLAGELIRSLKDPISLGQSQYEFVWDCANDSSMKVSEGMYLYVIHIDLNEEELKLVDRSSYRGRLVVLK